MPSAEPDSRGIRIVFDHPRRHLGRRLWRSAATAAGAVLIVIGLLASIGAVPATIAVLGLTFKPETDDMRDAPSLPIVSRLAEEGAAIRAFDPVGMDQARPMLPSSVQFCADAYDAATGADVLILITEWNEFRALSADRLSGLMRGRLVMDLRNVFDPAAMVAAGFDYRGIGRAVPVPALA